ncbi:hypothetical protein LZ554_008501 [Drepanopeziza brunnea f. sp. 'monogermtubi']|nr:hypothetical protein LZ554_008501 [Drepanopeziza brunnea f. sp. 'monogermtubi']
MRILLSPRGLLKSEIHRATDTRGSNISLANLPANDEPIQMCHLLMLVKIEVELRLAASAEPRERADSEFKAREGSSCQGHEKDSVNIKPPQPFNRRRREILQPSTTRDT